MHGVDQRLAYGSVFGQSRGHGALLWAARHTSHCQRVGQCDDHDRRGCFGSKCHLLNVSDSPDGAGNRRIVSV